MAYGLRAKEFAFPMKNTTLFLIAAIIIAMASGVMLVKSNKNNQNLSESSSNLVSSGEVQKIILSMKNGNYYPNTIRVKANQPVSISLDKNVGGCYRSFTIRQLGLAKYLPTPSDTINFTPKEKGIYNFACSMGMGTGTLIVE